MKTASIFALSAALIAAPLASVHAQEAPQEAAQEPSGFLFPVTTTTTTTEETAEETEAVPQKIEIPTDAIDSSAREGEENAILPDQDSIPAPQSPEASVESAAPLKKGTAEQLRQAARMRELKITVRKDPEVIAQRDLEQKATTPEGHRVALRNYYTLLYRKIIKADASLQTVATEELRQKLGKLEQSKIRPSQLVEDIKAIPGSRLSDFAGGANER